MCQRELELSLRVKKDVPLLLEQRTRKLSRPRKVRRPIHSPRHKLTPISESATLDNMPYDVHYLLLQYLDLASSASLAVACPSIYPLHRACHGSVSLNALASNEVGIEKRGATLLCDMLIGWMKKAELSFSWYNGLFVGLDRWLELVGARWSDGWESS
jgi:hypothetical protein